MDLKDKIVLITGATGGIGYELCKEFNASGAQIIALARTTEKLDKLAIELNNPNNIFYNCDFTKTSDLESVTDQILSKFEKVDVLINAAGVGVYKSLEEVQLSEWVESMDINVNAPFYLMKKLLPLLKKSEKSIVLNIGSGMGKIPTACRSVYCATKYALRGLTLSLASEFTQSNIHFVHVSLGSTLTEFGPLSLEQKREENLQGKSYLTPQWVAKKFIHVIENEEFQEEIEIYPSDYDEHS